MANKIYQVIETAITWRSTGGTHVITGTSLATLAGRQGDRHDLGTAAAPRRFRARLKFVPGGTRVVGEGVELWLKTGNGTAEDNDDGTSDAALSAADKLRNCLLVGTIQIDENAAVAMSRGWTVAVLDRYVTPIIYNRTTQTLSSTASDFTVDLEPVPDEVQ